MECMTLGQGMSYFLAIPEPTQIALPKYSVPQITSIHAKENAPSREIGLILISLFL